MLFVCFLIFLLTLLFPSNLIVTISNSDKNVENSELEQSIGAQKSLNIIELADIDGDGMISLDKELKQFLESNKFERIFKSLFDHQPKGELRLESFKKTLMKHFAGRRYAPQLPTLVNEVNVNKNGGIDWHEFKLFMYELGKQLVDADHDGFITVDESEAFYTWEYTLE
uniref:Putative effector protein n=1 Tax=Heterodera avenae TaxID=34510 RepID=A0A2L0VDN9_HETAV|nr:putative effector protein [Heterodera avenae]AVA09725.1 putative effector protein [Heterodera avenae]